MKDIIQVMPAVALRGMTILPDMIVHFDVSRSKSKKAVERAITPNQKLFVVTQRDPDIENPEKEELLPVVMRTHTEREFCSCIKSYL